MIDSTTGFWLGAGLAAGLLHSTMLWRAAHKNATWTPILGILRLGGVAGVLIFAALAGDILSAAAGWAVGFFALGAWFVLSRTARAHVSTNNHSHK